MATQRFIFGCQRSKATRLRRRGLWSLTDPRRKDLCGFAQLEADAKPSLESGGDSGARTRSLRLAKPALSQLSYIPGGPGQRPIDRVHGIDGGPGWTRTTHLTLIRRAL